MARFASLNPFTILRNLTVNFAVRLLTKPLKAYALHIPNDMTRLKRHLRKGDVILVEGNERISECIKYLTQSSWSHATLFVGDEPLRREPSRRAEFLEKFGEDADFMVLEALVDQGVVLSPLSKYRNFNIRVCRPYNLSSADLRVLLEEALGHVGDSYDIKNILDLARYFLPVSMVPRRFRRQALHFGSGEPTRVICSSLIAECFERVGFPIAPKFVEPPGEGPHSLFERLFGRDGATVYGVMRRVSPTLITPRDFDVSPYFEIIKFNVIESLRFDYRKILWADEPDETVAAKGRA
jgi:hypothetical protein